MFSSFFSWLERESFYNRRRYRRSYAPIFSTSVDISTREEDEESEEEEEPTPAVPIKVKKIDLEIDENTDAHHTDQYEITDVDDDDLTRLPDLVVRRGQPFNVTLTMSRNFNEETDVIKIVFETSDNPSPRNSTQKEMVVKKELEANTQWSAAFRDDKPNQGKTVFIQIQPSAKSVVSKWRMIASCRLRDSGERLRLNELKCKRSIYILFNAWCPEDAVYMEDEDWRNECVIQDDGYVYRGNRRARQQRGKAWQFSQFEDFVLDCSLHLLDMKRELLPFSQQGNPILVSRELGAAVNSSDDRGVLIGNWSGDYSGGARPTSWSNSADILEQFWRTKQPVKYGQCWVFSAVLNTVCRAVGLPCRSVTNYASAHDTDLSCTIDTYFDAGGDKDSWLTSDSVWNFHVWNEAWMTRPDLGAKYGGWQVIDATPQELSGAEREYKCGPASKYAILHGEIGHPYDTGFVFGETSSQRFNWNRDSSTGEYIVSGPTDAIIGAEISTKKPQNTLSRWADHADARLVLTREYKFEDGSEERKASLVHATSQGASDKNFYNAKPPDVTVDMLDFDEDIVVGLPFEVKIKVINHSSESRNFDGHIGICSCFHNSTPYKRLKNKIDMDQTIAGNSEELFVLKVEPEDYEGLVIDGCTFLVWIQGLVKETKQPVQDDRSYDLVIPNLVVEGPEKVSPGDDIPLEIKFTNPLHIRLSDVDIKISCPQLFRQKAFTWRNVKANEEIVIKRRYKAKKLHRYAARNDRDLRINVTFDSDELADVNGVHTLKLVH